jgi:hypothetical protein
MYLVIGHCHSKLLEVIDMIQQQLSSNENKNINTVPKYSFNSINFDILKTTIQYYAHTLSI